MDLSASHNPPITNEELVRVYNKLNSSDWRDIEELQKSRQILGLIKSILKSRTEEK